MMSELAVVGGDLRMVKLIEMLAKDERKVYTYSLENAEVIKQQKNIQKLENIEELKDFDVIIGGVPFSSNGVQINNPFSNANIDVEELFKNIKGKTLIAGNIQTKIEELAKLFDIKVIDLLKREELAILNTISTAEGAIQIAMSETSKTVHGSNVLVMGFGRIGKILAKMLNGIGACVYCEARKNEDLAWIKAYGYSPVKLQELDQNLNQFDIIINTIPAIILKEKQLQRLNKECIMIDIASLPGGVDKEAAKKLRNTIYICFVITSARWLQQLLRNL